MSATAAREPGRPRFRAPDTYVIIFFVVVFAAALTYLIPAGSFETTTVRFTDAAGAVQEREVLVPGSFELLRDDQGDPVRRGAPLFAPGGEAGLFNYAFEGLVSGSKWGAAIGVVAFILIIGGAFGIVLRTGAIEAGILAVIRKTSGAEALVVPVMFVLFSLGGAVFGMGEEAIAFAMILVPLVVALGYDAIVGVLITYVATQVGFATSWMNPFSVAIAQGVAEIPVLSGAPFRIAMWAFFTLFAGGWTWWYAQRIRREPSRSPLHGLYTPAADETGGATPVTGATGGAAKATGPTGTSAPDPAFTLGHKLVLLTVLAAVIWVVWGVIARQYYIPEIATQFFVMGVVAGTIGAVFRLNGMGVNEIGSAFRAGARDILDAALIVGMAKGIVLVLGGDTPTTPTVLNTLLHEAGGLIDDLAPALSASFMLAFQSVFNFFVVSGSGQAALTMPLMAPLADLAGVTRQVAVLAFQLGDGFTNIIVPTSGALIGTLGVARVDWAIWARFIWKFLLAMFAAAIAFVVLAVAIGYQ
ncbi:MAG: putative basic amino acid antiporter YfcC [Gemmatimonadota bacterium]